MINYFSHAEFISASLDPETSSGGQEGRKVDLETSLDTAEAGQGGQKEKKILKQVQDDMKIKKLILT